MNKSIRTISYCLISLLFIFTSCKKDKPVEEVTNSSTTSTYSPETNSTIAGSIIDENNNPIQGAQVSIGTNIQITDQNGLYIFENISTNKERTYIKITKIGYFDSSKIINPFEGQLTKVNAKLQSNAYIGNISASTGGSISLTNGAELVLPANGIIIESSNVAYTGNVNVSMAYLDASQPDIAFLAPGDMMAIDANGESEILTSYGMLNVELTGDAGEKLQISSGSEATITIPCSITNAPKTIPTLVL